MCLAGSCKNRWLGWLAWGTLSVLPCHAQNLQMRISGVVVVSTLADIRVQAAAISTTSAAPAPQREPAHRVEPLSVTPNNILLNVTYH